jgi:DNA polymerase/3'-5' exonuclease PolX
MKHAQALNVAQALMDYFQPACREIKIVGSVRRGKADVKDIELVCIADDAPPEKPKLEFGNPIPATHKTRLDELAHRMAQSGDARMEANGDRYKKMYLKYAGIKCELFINVPPAEWGVQLLIRTGPKDFSHWCVTSRKFGGALPDGYFVKHQVVWIAEEIEKRDIPDDPNKADVFLTDANHLSMHDEVDFLNFLGLGWIEPGERVARWKR